MKTSFSILLFTMVILGSLAACAGNASSGSSPIKTITMTPETPPEEMLSPTATVAAIQIPDPNLRFVDLQDGDTVALIDTPLGPAVQMLVEADDLWIYDGVFLQIDGLWMGLERNMNDVTSMQFTFTWYPWRGNGDYVLEISRWRSDPGTELGATRITVHVDSFPAGEPTIKNRFIQAYESYFGFELTDPVFTFYARNFNDDLIPSRWVSVAYIGNDQYEIDIYPDGREETLTRAIAYEDGYSAPICRPTGDHSMLVVLVDYGNTGISQEQASEAILSAAEFYNERYEELSERLGASGPLLQIHPVIAFLASPPISGQEVPVSRIQELTGYDPAQFDFVVQVDLDSAKTVAANYALGYGGTGCQGASRTAIDIFATVSAPEELQPDRMVGVLFDHELAHCLGWQHWWPVGDGGVAEALYSNWRHAYAFPYYLFGWVDSDEDGVLEILDTESPYGWTGK
jgi:hypothetical protein